MNKRTKLKSAKRSSLNVTEGLEVQVKYSIDGEDWLMGEKMKGPAVYEIKWDEIYFKFVKIILSEIS